MNEQEKDEGARELLEFQKRTQRCCTIYLILFFLALIAGILILWRFG